MKSFDLTYKASAFAELETQSVLGAQNRGMVKMARQMFSVMLPAQNVLSLQPSNSFFNLSAPPAQAGSRKYLLVLPLTSCKAPAAQTRLTATRTTLKTVIGFMFCSLVVSAMLKAGRGEDREKGWAPSRQRGLLRWIPCVRKERAVFTSAIST